MLKFELKYLLLSAKTKGMTSHILSDKRKYAWIEESAKSF